MTQPRRPVIFVIPQSAPREEGPPSPKEGTGADPHSEVERRRKLKITKCIQQLSEILGSSCHCGKETRAETLQRTVDQIKTLQGENEELERKIAKLPEPESYKESELNSQLAKLLVEHIVLRVQLLEHLEKQRRDANRSPSSEQLPKEREEGAGSLHTRDGETASLSSHQQQPWPVTSLLSHTPQAISSQTSCQTTVVMATHHQGCHGCQQEPVITQSRPPQQSIVQPWVVGGTSPRLHHVNPPPRPSPQSKNCQSFSPRSSTTRHRPYHVNTIRTCNHSRSDTHLPGNYRLHSRPPEYGSGHPTQDGVMYGSHAAQNSQGGTLSHPPPLVYTGAIPPPIPPYPTSHPLQLCDTPAERPITLLSHPPPPQVWRPYSEHSRTSGFCLADILSLPSSEEPPTLQLHPVPPPPPPPPPPPQPHTTSRMPSFLVDRLLDDI